MDVGTKDVQGTISLSPYRPGTNLRVSSALAPLPKTNFSLFAISNVFGWAIIVTSSDPNLGSGPAFLLTRLDDLQTTIDEADQFSTPVFNFQEKSQTVVVPTASVCYDASVFVTHVAFAAWDRLVIVATSDGSLHILSLYALVDQKSTVPLRSIHPASRVPLKMLVPNPSKGGPMSGVVALVYQDGTLKVVDCYDTGKTHWTGQLATAAEWSPMGKRLFVGYSNGRLEFLTHDGITKGTIDPPPLAEKERLSVLHIKWLDQKNYIITFTPTGDQADEMNETYCLHVPKQSEASACTFARVVDAITSDGDTSLPPELLTVAVSVNPQTNWKHIAISSFTNSTSLTLVGYDKSDTPCFLELEEGRPEIPVAEEDYSPTAPLGFALSFCTRQKTPLIWCYSTDGVLSLWQLSLVDPSIPDDVKVWSEISDSDDISTVEEKGIEQTPPASKPLNSGDAPTSSHVVPQRTVDAQSSGFGSFVSSAATTFGTPSLANSQASLGPFSSSQNDTFRQVSLGNGTSQSPAFGQPSAFGQPPSTAPSPFGQPSAFGKLGPSTSSSPFGQASVFGQQTSSTSSAFGEPTALGKSDSTTSPSPFGQASAFGKPASLPFGQPNALEKSTTSAPVSAFGQPPSATVSAFGQPPSATVSAFGKPPSATVSAFGKPPSATVLAFGQPAPSQTSAFGQPASSQVTAFGQPSAFASTASPAQVSAFGQPSAFGKPASPAPVSAFGQPGAFGKPTFPASSIAFPSTSAFGKSPFGATAFGDTGSLVRPPLEGATATSSAGFAAFANSSSKSEVSSLGGFAQFTNTTNQTSFLSGDTASTSTNVLDNPHSDAAESAQKSQTANTNSFSQSSCGPASSVFTKPEGLSFSKNSTAATTNLSNFQPRVTEIHEGKEEEARPQSAGSGTSSPLSDVADDISVSQLSQTLDSIIDATSVPAAPHVNALDALSLDKPTSSPKETHGSVQQATHQPNPQAPSSSVRPASFGFGGFTQPAPSRTLFFGTSVPLTSTLPQSIPSPPSAQPSESRPPPASMASQLTSTPTHSSSKSPPYLTSPPSAPPANIMESATATPTPSCPEAPTSSPPSSSPKANSPTSPPSPSSLQPATCTPPASSLKVPTSTSSPSSLHATVSTPPPSSLNATVSMPLPSSLNATVSTPPPSSLELPDSAPEPSTETSLEHAGDRLETPEISAEIKNIPSSCEQDRTSDNDNENLNSKNEDIFGSENEEATSEDLEVVSETGDIQSEDEIVPSDDGTESASDSSSSKDQLYDELEVSHRNELEAVQEDAPAEFQPESSDERMLATSAPEEIHTAHAPEETQGNPALKVSQGTLEPKEQSSDEGMVATSAPEEIYTAHVPEETQGNLAPEVSQETPEPKEQIKPPKPPFLTTRPEFIAPITSLCPTTVPKIIVNSDDTFPDIAGKDLRESLTTITDSITSGIDCLAPAGSVCRRYLQECHKKLQNGPGVADLQQFQNWAFGDLPTLRHFIQRFAEYAQRKKVEYETRKKALPAIEGFSIKGDMKLDEIKRLWRLRNDPGFSQVVRSRQLGPVQLAHQKDMRRLIRDVKHGISQMSEVLQSFESCHRDAKSDRNRMQTPSLDMINRCIRCITLGFTQYIIDLEKMHLWVCQTKVATSTPQDETHIAQVGSLAQQGSSRTPDQAAALRALMSEHKGALLKESIMKHRTEPILTRAQRLRQLNPSVKPHALSHISATRTLIVTPRQKPF
ncbi:hypothetical protein Pst134EB_014850 [Puccinia striiformis f. sp. tritici]|nr:hypothetical protein Pst134EB_014850 [Puccinia striiformis f. sp. tritici]